MQQGVIVISENGKVSVPNSVQMRDFEIAELFGVMVPTVKGKMRQILKEGICGSDLSTGGIVVGNTVMPEYYELDMIIALSFRIQSPQAEVFRRWVLSKAIDKGRSISPQVFVSVNSRISKELN